MSCIRPGTDCSLFVDDFFSPRGGCLSKLIIISLAFSPYSVVSSEVVIYDGMGNLGILNNIQLILKATFYCHLAHQRALPNDNVIKSNIRILPQ